MPALDHDRCYAALTARDRRFDGRFWVGVHTTGVYCRPVCPSRTPRSSNVGFYAHPAAAEDAGFRPCKRCQPDAVPGTPAWDEPAALVERALGLIDAGALDDGGVDDLATRLAVSGRHLRRLFEERLGTSPDAVARSRRAHLARRLLVDSDLRVADVAFAAGFGSLRQANDVIRATFGATPTELRRHARAGRGQMPAALGASEHAPRPPWSGSAGGTLRLRLPARAPFAGDELLDWFAARALPGIEWVADGAYHRRLRLADATCGLVSVTPGCDHVALAVDAPPATQLSHLVARVKNCFDLDANPEAVTADLRADPVIGPLVRAAPGRRVPGCWSPWEMSVRAIVGQQVSVAAARTVVARFVEALGDSDFPPPAALADAPLESLGLIAQRANSIRELARRVETGALHLDGSVATEQLAAALVDIPGIGRWTAETIALRTGEPDVFPAGDLHLRRVVAASGHGDRERDVRRLAAMWSPWRSYAALHLFHQPMEPRS